MEKEKTAIQQLIESLEKDRDQEFDTGKFIDFVLKPILETEKQQIVEAYTENFEFAMKPQANILAEQYYNNKYKGE